MLKEKKYYSVAELAALLGVSRVAIFKRIKSGKIKAERIGRVYAIPREEVGSILGTSLTEAQKKVIDEGVRKTVAEYGEVLEKLGKE